MEIPHETWLANDAGAASNDDGFQIKELAGRVPI
jgi:hypothetical protein